MATALNSVLDRDLARRLARLDWQLRRVRIIRGLGWLAVVMTLALAGAFVFDLIFKPVAAIRGVLLAAVGLGGLVTLFLGVVRPALRKHTPAELAAVVEHAHPELAERLTSAIELNDASLPEEWRGSALMRKMLTRQALKSVAPIDFTASVSQTRALQASLAGLAALVLLIVPSFVAPQTYKLLWWRLFSPWGNFETPGNLSIQVEGGDRIVASGDDVEIRAQAQWRYSDDSPPELRLHWRDDAGTNDSRQMQRDPASGVYSTTLTNVFHPLDFHVAAGRDRSRTFHVEVVERPEVLTAVLDVEPPAYTGLPAQRIDGVRGEVRVFEHSRMDLTLTFNKPVASAEWHWLHGGDGGKSEPAFLNVAANDEQPAGLPLVLADDRLSARLALTADRGGAFAFDLTDAHALHNSGEPERVLVITPDAPPELALGGSSQPRKARPDDLVRVDMRASDDIGLGAVELHYEILRGEQGVIVVDAADVRGRELSHTFELNLTELGAQSGSLFSYRVRAADERPVPAPNETWSEPRVISVDKEAGPPEATDVAERQQELRKLLDEIRRDLDTNEAQVAGLHEAVAATDADAEFERDEEISAAARDQRKLAERVENFAGRLAEHPLYANLTEDASAVGRETLEPAGRALEQAAAQPVAEKAESLQKNAEQLAVADQELAELAARFDDLARLEQELLELNRLARQAEQLAERALDLDRRRRAEPENETPEERAAREAQLREDNDALAREHTELMRQLDSLLERRPEILEAARQSELDRLAELSRRMRELIEPQDLLADALREEAEAAAGDLAPLAERQEELVRQAEELARQTDPRTTRRPVQPLDPERLREALEALQAGDLAAAEERQQAAADELEQLAAELEKNEQLPDDPQHAAEQLARRQRDLDERIQAAAENVPGAEASEQQQQEFQEQLRGLAREQAGIQAGASALDAPRGARESQQRAVDRAGDAVEQLLAGQPQPAAAASQRAADALQELSREIGTPEERTARAREAVAQLREQQQTLANEARQAAAAAETAEANGEPADDAAARLEALAEHQHEIARDVADLDAPGAEAEQRAAVRRQASALTDLQRQAAADIPASQAQADQALERLERRLAGEEIPLDAADVAENGEAAERPSIAEQAEQLARRQQELADRAEQAAEAGDVPAAAERQQAGEQLAAIRRETEQLRAGENAAAAQREAIEQLRKADEAQRQAAERAQAEQPADANAQAPEASDELERLMQHEAQAQDRAAESLRELAERLQSEESRSELARRDEQDREQLEQLAGADAEPAGPMGAEPAGGRDREAANQQNSSGRNQPPGNQQPAPAATADNAARQAQELARQQRELAQQAAAARAAQQQQESEQAAAQPAGDPPANAAAGQDANQPPDGGEQAAQSPVAAQQQLAREAAELALDAARQTGADSEPATQAAQFARECAQCAGQAGQGRLGDAARSARAAAESGEQAAGQLGGAPGVAGQQLQQRASELAQRQAAQADALEQAAQSGGARRAAQQSGQEQLAASAGELAEQLAEVAENLGSQPLDLAESAEQAQSGQQATQSARESMQQAAGAIGQGNSGQAAESAREAAARLRRAAEEASSAPMETTPSDVPADVAGQVAEAARQLDEARRHLAEAENSPAAAEQSAQPGSPPADAGGSPMTAGSQPGSSAAGEPSQSRQAQGAESQAASPGAQSAPGTQPGQSSQAGSGQPSGSSAGAQQAAAAGPPSGQPAQGPPGGTPLADTARSLQQAARALAQVAGQAAQAGQSAGSPSGGQPGQSQSASASPGPPGAQGGSAGTGSRLDAPIDSATLDQELKRLSSRQWGQLPGHLRTEILQAARKQANSDYERLIKLYFEEVARTQGPQPSRNADGERESPAAGSRE